MLEELSKQFSISYKLGLELEFYILGTSKERAEFFILEHCQKIMQEKFALDIVQERGYCQYEMVFKPVRCAEELGKNLVSARQYIKKIGEQHGLQLSFAPKPLADDYGSGMHLHVSIYDSLGNNLFFAEKYLDNALFKATMLFTLDQIVNCMGNICTVADLPRFVPEFMAPVYMCWGINNREAAIRIPNSNIADRRFELRIPGASSSYWPIVEVIAKGLCDGLTYYKNADLIKEMEERYPLLYGRSKDLEGRAIKISDLLCAS